MFNPLKMILGFVLNLTAGGSKAKLVEHLESISAATDDEKRKSAVDLLKEDFRINGKSAKDKLIPLAAEAALIYVKKGL